MECTHKVLPGGQVDARLPPDRRIDLRDKRRRHVNKRHATQPRRREEPGRISKRAAADRDERLAAVRPEDSQRRSGALDDAEAFRVFAGRKQDALDRPALVCERRGDRSAGRVPRRRFRDEDRPPRAQTAERVRDAGRGDLLADDDVAAERSTPEQHVRSAPGRGPRYELVGPFDDRPQLRDAVEPMRGRVEALAVTRELADRSHRVTPGHQRAHVRRPPKPLGENLRPDVEPDRQAIAIEMPPVAWIDDGSAARGDDPPDGRVHVGRAEGGNCFALVGPESGLAVVGKDLRDGPPGGFLDRLVKVDERSAMAMGEPAPDGALAAAR